ncbi:cyclin [Colletotrichum orchidophilum]|uniref:Cyclin n=1 Tax=Colletotrichum orchidophilum TaxID=1209926 RepID=A0A1G4AMB4_9PEZI|nr:cyclin [Colletotrichum orchidophilum]OHE90318.1 cyclin [Colletotrichum orchidophilum]
MYETDDDPPQLPFRLELAIECVVLLPQEVDDHIVLLISLLRSVAGLVDVSGLFVIRSQTLNGYCAGKVQMHRSPGDSCQLRLPSSVRAVIDHQAPVFARWTGMASDTRRFELFCRRPPSLRLVTGMAERILSRVLPINSDIWDFPSDLAVFLRHLLLWADISGAVLCGSLIYLERGLQRPQNSPMTEANQHLRVLAAVILARKYLEDVTYKTSFWTGLTAEACSFHFTDDDINVAECRLLEDVAWDLSIDGQEMHRMVQLVCGSGSVPTLLSRGPISAQV